MMPKMMSGAVIFFSFFETAFFAGFALAVGFVSSGFPAAAINFSTFFDSAIRACSHPANPS
jgi:hypothetical protein